MDGGKQFCIKVTIEKFEIRPDERGYLVEWNKLKLLETCTADTPQDRAKTSHLVNAMLNEPQPFDFQSLRHS